METTRIHARTCTHTHIHTHTRARTHTHTHTLTHTYTHAHIHTQLKLMETSTRASLNEVLRLLRKQARPNGNAKDNKTSGSGGNAALDSLQEGVIQDRERTRSRQSEAAGDETGMLLHKVLSRLEQQGDKLDRQALKFDAHDKLLRQQSATLASIQARLPLLDSATVSVSPSAGNARDYAEQSGQGIAPYGKRPSLSSASSPNLLKQVCRWLGCRHFNCSRQTNRE